MAAVLGGGRHGIELAVTPASERFLDTEPVSDESVAAGARNTGDQKPATASESLLKIGERSPPSEGDFRVRSTSLLDMGFLHSVENEDIFRRMSNQSESAVSERYMQRVLPHPCRSWRIFSRILVALRNYAAYWHLREGLW